MTNTCCRCSNRTINSNTEHGIQQVPCAKQICLELWHMN